MNLRRFLPWFATLGALCTAQGLHAYALIGGAWPTGSIPIQLQLDATAPSTTTLPLNDGSLTWNAVAQSALDEWNSILRRSRFASTINSSTKTGDGDGITNIFFSNTIYGDTFDTFTLAVTLTDNYDTDDFPTATARIREADLIVNSNRIWNSYRGAIRTNPGDVRRVLLHELGHVLGLDHPDRATPAQNVTAIMNSTISDLESLQADDTAGATLLYGAPLVAPVVTRQPTSQSITVGNATSFSVGLGPQASAPISGPLLTYSWYYQGPGATRFEKLFTVSSAALELPSVQTADAGSYFFRLTTPDATIDSDKVTLTVTPATTSASTTLANLSTRGTAGAGNRSMIVGFVVTGSRNKTILLRAAGPGLANFGVSGTLADPQLVLKNVSGTVLATSAAVWSQSANANEITEATNRVGAFAFAAGSRDAVILTSVAPGNYTAQATSPSGATGTVLIEAYDADVVPDASSRLANLSTRGYVGSADDLLIAGFVVRGPGPRTYLIRVSGASLADFGVGSTLYDPILKLFSGTTQLRMNDDWDSPASGQAALNTAFQQAGAFAFPYPSTVNGNRLPTAMQSAMLVTLAPGSYTAQASGNDNDGRTSVTGNSLIEIYEMSSP